MALDTRLGAFATRVANYLRDAIVPRLPVSQALTAVLESAARSFHNNPRSLPLADPVTIAAAASLQSGFTRSFAITGSHPFAIAGGLPVNASGATTFPCVTLTGSSRTGVAWRVETVLDGDEIVFALDGGATTSYRLLVNGRYTSLGQPFALAGQTTAYYRVSFGSRALRSVAIEGSLNARFVSANTKSDQTLLPPSRRALRVVVVGDSNVMATGQDIRADGFARIAGDFMGVADIWAVGVAGTGFVATNGGANHAYSAHRSDWLDSAVKPDILVLSGSANDVTEGASAAAVKAAAIAEMTAARAAYPRMPIVLVGMAGARDYFTIAGVIALFDAMETALKEAVDAMADPLIAFMPLLSAPESPPMFGTGPGQGNFDLYNQMDGHASTAGHRYLGEYIGRRLIETLAKMAGVPVPVPAPPPPFDYLSPSVAKAIATSDINTQAADYTLAATDAGKTIYRPTTDTTARTWTIPASGAVSLSGGVVITLDNDGPSGAVTIAINTDTLSWVPTGATGPRTLAPGGSAVIRKVSPTRWRISGVGLT